MQAGPEVIMLRLLFFTALSLAAGTAEPTSGNFLGPGSPHSLPPGLSVSLRTSTTTLVVGEAVPIEVRLLNSGTAAVEVSPILEPQSHWISFDVSGERGAPVKFIGPRKKMGWDGRTLSIEPGCFWGRTFDLAKLFDLHRPGQYEIRATYAPSGPFGAEGFAAIITDLVRITVKGRD